MTDCNDCEDCGGGYAEGAIVYIDGEEILDFTLIAHCYNSTSYDPNLVYYELFKHLGYELEMTYE